MAAASAARPSQTAVRATIRKARGALSGGAGPTEAASVSCRRSLWSARSSACWILPTTPLRTAYPNSHETDVPLASRRVSRLWASRGRMATSSGTTGSRECVKGDQHAVLPGGRRDSAQAPHPFPGSSREPLRRGTHGRGGLRLRFLAALPRAPADRDREERGPGGRRRPRRRCRPTTRCCPVTSARRTCRQAATWSSAGS